MKGLFTRSTFFNKNYDETIQVNNKKIKIPLHDLGIGRYVIETVLKNKRIIIVLFRNKPITKQYVTKAAPIIEYTPEVIEDKEEIATVKDNSDYKEIAEKKVKKNTNISSENINDLLNYRRPIIKKASKKKKEKKSNYNYWVYYKINSGHYSKTIRKMATKDEVDWLISRNQLDVKTLKGQSNILKIWEVYDKSMFVKQKELDENFIYTKSPYFNEKLFYTTDSYGFGINLQAN